MLALSDEWLAVFRSLCVSIIVSNCPEHRLPWEVAVYGKTDHIPGIPETIEIPLEVECVQQALNMRRQCLSYFSATETYTLEDMKNIVGGQNKANMLACDRCCQMELFHLENQVAVQLSEGIHAMAIAALPGLDVKEPPLISAAINALEELKTHRWLAAAVGLQACTDFTTTLKYLHNLAIGRPPTAKQIKDSTPYFQENLSRMAMFCSECVKEKKPKTMFYTSSFIFGVEAAAAKWPKSKPEGLNELTDLRRFEWLLTGSQQKQLGEWVKDLTRLHRASHGLTALCNGPIELEAGGDALMLGAAGGVSSSSIFSGAGPIMAYVPTVLAANSGKKGHVPVIDTKSKIKALYKSTISKKGTG